jgi:cytochrome c-type biogenesis protein CcmH/NrfG
VLLVGLSFVVVAFTAVSLWLSQTRKVTLRTWLASAVLVSWVVVVGLKVHFDRATSAPNRAATASLASIAWPEPSTPQAARAGGASMQIAPVDSLVGGLEKRLAEQPDDAGGWALLAQSYAFVGDSAAVERAVAKAVALGLDEQTLRTRVDGATRDPHPGVSLR